MPTVPMGRPVRVWCHLVRSCVHFSAVTGAVQASSDIFEPAPSNLTRKCDQYNHQSRAISYASTLYCSNQGRLQFWCAAACRLYSELGCSFLSLKLITTQKLRLAEVCRIHQNNKGCDVLWKTKKTAGRQCNQTDSSAPLKRTSAWLAGSFVKRRQQHCDGVVMQKQDIQTARPYGSKGLMSPRRLRPNISRSTTVAVKNPNSTKPLPMFIYYKQMILFSLCSCLAYRQICMPVGMHNLIRLTYPYQWIPSVHLFGACRQSLAIALV